MTAMMPTSAAIAKRLSPSLRQACTLQKASSIHTYAPSIHLLGDRRHVRIRVSHGGMPRANQVFGLSSSGSISISTNVARNRAFSTIPPPLPPSDGSAAPSPASFKVTPPDSLTPEAGLAAQDAMMLFVQYGLGKRRLDEIAAERRSVS